MTRAKEGQRGGTQTARSRINAGVIGMLGREQVTPRWADDTMQRHIGGGGVGAGRV